MADQVTAVLRAHAFHVSHEEELQGAIAQLLDEAAIPFVREHRLSAADRVDFMFSEGVALEVKVDGSLSSVLRQLHRYAQHPDVERMLLVTTRATHRAVPAVLSGKPVAVVHVGGIG